MIPTLLAVLAVGQAASPNVRDTVTFADAPSLQFIPLREVGAAFDRPVAKANGQITLAGRAIPVKDVRRLTDGTILVPLGMLRSYGFIVNPNGKRTTIKDKKKPGRLFYARRGAKRVVINKKEQTLLAFQGERKVMTTNVSTGREAKQTPTGLFKAQAFKDPTHRSKLHNQAYMPWSVQIVGNVFIHGFKSVPGRAASSGCIRLPLTNGNPARWFYHWVEPGTSVQIGGKWPAGAIAAKKS